MYFKRNGKIIIASTKAKAIHKVISNSNRDYCSLYYVANTFYEDPVWKCVVVCKSSNESDKLQYVLKNNGGFRGYDTELETTEMPNKNDLNKLGAYKDKKVMYYPSFEKIIKTSDWDNEVIKDKIKKVKSIL